MSNTAAALPGAPTLAEGSTLNLTTPSGLYTGTILRVQSGHITLSHMGHTFTAVHSLVTGHWYAGEGGPRCRVLYATAG